MPYKDPERQKQATADWQRANKERVNAKSKRWRERNAEHCKAYKSAEKKRNRAYYTALQAERRAAQHRATPTWVVRDELLAVYKACPAGYEVDHIVPLLGKSVCGLHVPWNLQITPKTKNRSKGNRVIN